MKGNDITGSAIDLSSSSMQFNFTYRTYHTSFHIKKFNIEFETINAIETIQAPIIIIINIIIALQNLKPKLKT